MTERLKNSVFGILSWLKEQQSAVSTSLDELAAQFDLNRDQMQSQMQWLQRYECVKRGGRENAEWSITDRGLVRLAEGRFSPSGAFLSPFDQTERSSGNTQDPARPVTVITVPLASENRLPDTGGAASFPSTPTWPWPMGFFHASSSDR